MHDIWLTHCTVLCAKLLMVMTSFIHNPCHSVFLSLKHSLTIAFQTDAVQYLSLDNHCSKQTQLLQLTGLLDWMAATGTVGGFTLLAAICAACSAIDSTPPPLPPVGLAATPAFGLLVPAALPCPCMMALRCSSNSCSGQTSMTPYKTT